MSVWEEVRREIDELTRDIRALPVVSPVSAQRLRDEIESRFDLRTPMALKDVARAVSGLFRSSHVQVTHPRYFGLFNPSVREAGILADTLAALHNPQLAAWSHSPAACELERLTLRYFAAALGLAPDTAFATFTTGGQEANMSAVLTALAERFPDAARSGLAAAGDPVIYVTSESHHSFVKIVKMAGMGTRALSEVGITARFTVDVDALRRQLDADVTRGRHPLMIVGTAGTTGGGTVDPLAALADVAAAFKVWFHVDAAWGGAAALVPRLRPFLDGIERANSITWDAHKWLSVPMGAGMFFCSAPDAVRRAFGVSTTYMPESAGVDTFDPYLMTMQWSRRAIGLKVFMTLAELGASGLAHQIDGQARMGDRLRLLLRDAGWTIANDTVLPLVCFTHPDIREGRLTTTAVLHELYARGKVWISDVVLGGSERVLRACITSFRTEEQDLVCLIEELEAVRQSLNHKSKITKSPND
jgi:glutamate/tyrosine decarboxylase-like PLP-dependent enzyme